MIRRRLIHAALLAYPPATRSARGAEMRDTLLEATDGHRGAFIWQMLSLIRVGVSERAREGAGATVARTLADSCKLASILFVVLWLLRLIELHGHVWRGGQPVTVTLVGLLAAVVAWLLARQRIAGILGAASTILLLLNWRRLGGPDPISLLIALMPGFVIMSVAPARRRPSSVAVAGLAALIGVSVILAPGGQGGWSIALLGASVAGLLIFVVQPRLAIAAAIIWTSVGVQAIAGGTSPHPPWTLLIVVAPAVLAASAVRARIVSRAAS
jgi:hypothetical protein